MRETSTHGEVLLLDQNQTACVGQPAAPLTLATLNNFGLIALPCAGYVSVEGVPYQLSTVSQLGTVVLTGNGESGFDSGEGALKSATTSKEGSRHANYPMVADRGSDEK